MGVWNSTVGHDGGDVLELEFSGSIVRFRGVPRPAAVALKNSSSPGRYFAGHICDMYLTEDGGHADGGGTPARRRPRKPKPPPTNPKQSPIVNRGPIVPVRIRRG